MFKDSKEMFPSHFYCVVKLFLKKKKKIEKKRIKLMQGHDFTVITVSRLLTYYYTLYVDIIKVLLIWIKQVLSLSIWKTSGSKKFSKYLQPGPCQLMFPGLSRLSCCSKARHQPCTAFLSLKLFQSVLDFKLCSCSFFFFFTPWTYTFILQVPKRI